MLVPISETNGTVHNSFILLLLANQVDSELKGFVRCFAFGSNVIGCNYYSFQQLVTLVKGSEV